MLPFQSFNGYHCGNYLQEPSSLIKPMQSDGGRSTLSSASERRSDEACKNHREAERRRRQRINAHLSTLRSLLPNAAKSDKASLLAEVVQQVKELRKQADDVARRHRGYASGSSGCESGSDHAAGTDPWPFPGESDDATLSYCSESAGEPKLMKATLSCEDRPNLNRELTQAIRSVRAKAVRAEMMTFGGRTKSVVIMQWPDEGEERVGALRRALKAVVENRALVGYGLGQMVMGYKWAQEICISPTEAETTFCRGRQTCNKKKHSERHDKMETM